MIQKILFAVLILSVSVKALEVRDIFQCQNNLCYQQRYLAEQTSGWEQSLNNLQLCLASGQNFDSCVSNWENGYPERQAFADCLTQQCNFFSIYNSCQTEAFQLWECQADQQCFQSRLQATVGPIFVCLNIRRTLNCSQLTQADWTQCNYQQLINCTNYQLKDAPADNILSRFYNCQAQGQSS